MHISASLPSPLNITTSRRPPSQRGTTGSSQGNITPDAPRQTTPLSDRHVNQRHFVMPDNATTRSGQIALREYQTIQQGGGPELVNRIDVRV